MAQKIKSIIYRSKELFHSELLLHRLYSTMNISLFSYRDMSMTNLEEETVSAYLYPNTKKVAIVYDNEPLITYELDEIDVTNK